MAESDTAVASRGRPRDGRADAAIAAAVLELLVEVGYPRLTMEAVAARAGVGKATIYRRHASKAALVFAVAIHPGELRAVDTGTLRGDLALLSERILADLDQPVAAAAIPGLLADLGGEPGLREHFHTLFITSEQQVITDLLERAVARGEITSGADPDLVHAVLLGSIFAALFLLNLAPGPDLPRRLADLTHTALTTTGKVSDR